VTPVWLGYKLKNNINEKQRSTNFDKRFVDFVVERKPPAMPGSSVKALAKSRK